MESCEDKGAQRAGGVTGEFRLQFGPDIFEAGMKPVDQTFGECFLIRKMTEQTAFADRGLLGDCLKREVSAPRFEHDRFRGIEENFPTVGFPLNRNCTGGTV